MLSFLNRRAKNIEKVTKRQLKENKQVIESLRAYDEGKKEISTDHVAKRLSGVRTTP